MGYGLLTNEVDLQGTSLIRADLSKANLVGSNIKKMGEVYLNEYIDISCPKMGKVSFYQESRMMSHFPIQLNENLCGHWGRSDLRLTSS